jgi:hypothetical protein
VACETAFRQERLNFLSERDLLRPEISLVHAKGGSEPKDRKGREEVANVHEFLVSEPGPESLYFTTFWLGPE